MTAPPSEVSALFARSCNDCHSNQTNWRWYTYVAPQSVRAKLAIPQHFGTFPGIAATADGFAAELKKLKVSFYEMKPGETISFRGSQMVKR
jgi:L-ascorbate metabolism protein UlaG (beta-lactamase superfamily)